MKIVSHKRDSELSVLVPHMSLLIQTRLSLGNTGA